MLVLGSMANLWKTTLLKLQNQNLQAVLLLIFWTFGSRFLGFVRSFLVLQMNTIDAEIFNSSFVLSEAITSFFILGSITVATLPIMIKIQNPKSKNQNNSSNNTTLDQLNETNSENLKANFLAENEILNNPNFDNLDFNLQKTKIANNFDNKNDNRVNFEDFNSYIENEQNKKFEQKLVNNSKTFQRENSTQSINEKFETRFIFPEIDNNHNPEKINLAQNLNNFHKKSNDFQEDLTYNSSKNTKEKRENEPKPNENNLNNSQNQNNSQFKENNSQTKEILENNLKRSKYHASEMKNSESNYELENNRFDQAKKANFQKTFWDKAKIVAKFQNWNQKLTANQVKKLEEKSKKYFTIEEKLSIYTSWSLVILSGFILILSLLGIIFVEPVLATFNPSFFGKVRENGKLAQMLELNKLLLLAPFLFAVKTILGVFLNIKKNYKIYSLEGVLANLGWILALSVLYPIWGLVGAGSGMFLGFGITILLFFWQATTLGLRFNLGNFPDLWDFLWQTFGLYWPRLLIFSNTRLAEIIVAATSSNPNDPQITSVAMALNFQGIFIGVVLAVGTVFLPNLTEVLVQKGKNLEFWQMLIKYIKVNFFLAIAGTILTIIGVPILLWILTRLPFINSKGLLSDPIAVNLILQFTFISSFSLIFQSVGEVLNRYFIAAQRRWEPVIISIGGNFLAIQVALLFTKSWGSGAAAIGGFVLNSALFCSLSVFFCYQDWQAQLKPKTSLEPANLEPTNSQNF